MWQVADVVDYRMVIAQVKSVRRGGRKFDRRYRRIDLVGQLAA